MSQSQLTQVYDHTNIRTVETKFKPLFENGQESLIMDEKDLEDIYLYIPNYWRLCDPRLIYNSGADGRSLQSFMTKAEAHKDYPLILLIQSNHGAAFGCYFNHGLDAHCTKFIGNQENFVFKLKPHFQVYKSTGSNEFYFYCDGIDFFVGSEGKGNAIYLDSNLLFGSSSNCNTFDNEPLHESTTASENLSLEEKVESFTIFRLEAYILVS